MNAPDTATIQFIPLANLFPSPTNPRKRFDEAKLQELADSIKAQGILQPLLVRAQLKPFDAGTFEVIAGERRYRAAKIAGEALVPCFVRDLTDMQVLHAQVIENLQRDDLHPIEEAEGYEHLMYQKNLEDVPYSVTSIAAEIGKSREYVYGRMKLLDLCEEAREAFFKGELDASTALLIARIQPEKLQLEAMNEIIEDDMSYRTARDHVQNYYMLDLAKAPWQLDDAALHPNAGACKDCPNRTGNQPELFGDVSSKDVCTDTTCFAAKKMAWALKLTQDAEAAGHKVIKAKEAKKMLPHQYMGVDYLLRQQGLVSLDDEIPNDPEERTWGDALNTTKLKEKDGKPALQKTIIENPHKEGEIIQAINIEEATKALRQAGFVITPVHQAKATGPRETKQQKEEKEQLEIKLAEEKAYRTSLFNATRASIEQDLQTGAMRPELFLLLAEDAFDAYGYDSIDRLVATYLPDFADTNDTADMEEAFTKALPTLTPAQHFMIVFDLLMSRDMHPGLHTVRTESKPEMMLRIAAIEGVDPEAVRIQAIHQHRIAEDAKAVIGKKPAGKKSAKKGGAA